jgi:uncharacterized protein YeaO (DUF488 family)
MKSAQKIQCKRAYDAVEKDDGYRVLVDRIWPRGVSKEALKLDDWKKELAPSSELRKWFGHDPKRWAAFYQKYHAELDRQKEALDELRQAAAGTTLTLVYAAKDRDHNNAEALKLMLDKELSASA